MKEKDLLMISLLRNNARQTLTMMSRKTNIPISTLFEKLKQNEGRIIRKHTTLIDFSKIGFTTTATIMFKVKTRDKDNIQDYLIKNPNTNSVFRINNGFDFLVEAIFKSIKELELFLDTVEEKFPITSKKVYYVIDELKREDFFCSPDAANFSNITLQP